MFLEETGQQMPRPPPITSSPSHLFLSWHLQQSLPAPLTCSCLGISNNHFQPLSPCSCPGTNHFHPLSPVLVLAPPTITSSLSPCSCPGTNHFQPLSPVLVLAPPTITSSLSHLFLSWHLHQSLPAPSHLFLSWPPAD